MRSMGSLELPTIDRFCDPAGPVFRTTSQGHVRKELKIELVASYAEITCRLVDVAFEQSKGLGVKQGLIYDDSLPFLTEEGL